MFYTPKPDELIIYNCKILKFIEYHRKYGTSNLIDVQVGNEIKPLWFNSPDTRFWRVLKDNYPNAYLTFMDTHMIKKKLLTGSCELIIKYCLHTMTGFKWKRIIQVGLKR
jgi:hypothetical protein